MFSAAMLLLVATAGAYGAVAREDGGAVTLRPATFARVGTVDERYQSYNVEMVEVTGGRFWKPYGSDLVAPPIAARPRTRLPRS